MITKSHLSTTAPTVALVLSFAAVLLLGRSLEPVLPGHTGSVQDLGGNRYSLGAVRPHEKFESSYFSPEVLDRSDDILAACITVPEGYWLPGPGPDPGEGWEAWDARERRYCTDVPPGTVVTFALEKQ